MKLAKFHLISVLCACSILVDYAQGYFFYVGMALQFSILYKLLLIGIFFCLNTSRDRITAVVCFLIVCVWSLAFHTRSTTSITEVLENLVWPTRILLLVLCYEFFRNEILTNSRASIESWLNIIPGTFFWVIAFAILLGSFGFGQPMYGDESDGIATKGYFYAGNDASVAFAVSSYCVFVVHLAHSARLIATLIFIVSLGTGLLMGTKIAALAFPILVALHFFPRQISGFIRGNISRTALTIFFFCATAIAFLVPPMLRYLLFEEGLYERLKMAWDTGGIWTVLFSGRFERVESSIAAYLTDFSPVQMLFGVGIQYFDKHDLSATESDFFDILIGYGPLALIMVYGFLFSVYLHSRKGGASLEPRFSKSMQPLIVLSILLSIVAGHVVTSATVAIILGYSFSLVHYRRPSSAARPSH